jgi:hypothetical protein
MKVLAGGRWEVAGTHFIFSGCTLPSFLPFLSHCTLLPFPLSSSSRHLLTFVHFSSSLIASIPISAWHRTAFLTSSFIVFPPLEVFPSSAPCFHHNGVSIHHHHCASPLISLFRPRAFSSTKCLCLHQPKHFYQKASSEQHGRPRACSKGIPGLHGPPQPPPGGEADQC